MPSFALEQVSANCVHRRPGSKYFRFDGPYGVCYKDSQRCSCSVKTAMNKWVLLHSRKTPFTKPESRGWRDGSVGKGAWCEWTGPEFKSQEPSKSNAIDISACYPTSGGQDGSLEVADQSTQMKAQASGWVTNPVSKSKAERRKRSPT